MQTGVCGEENGKGLKERRENIGASWGNGHVPACLCGERKPHILRYQFPVIPAFAVNYAKEQPFLLSRVPADGHGDASYWASKMNVRRRRRDEKCRMAFCQVWAGARELIFVDKAMNPTLSGVYVTNPWFVRSLPGASAGKPPSRGLVAQKTSVWANRAVEPGPRLDTRGS